LPQVRQLDPDIRRDIRIVATVLPFKVNNYVLDELIDWTTVPNDPIFRLTFPSRTMLPKDMYDRVAQILDSGRDVRSCHSEIEGFRRELDPYLDDKPTWNRPLDGAGPIDGLMHKYPDSVLFFPPEGQTCHAYCGYCYRWGQLVGPWEIRQRVQDIDRVLAYILKHREISDVLLSGGDPMIMAAETLERYIDPLLGAEADHLQTLRFCTKALSYWPYRFTTDPDADALLRLFERCIRSGRQVSVMAHVTHVRELRSRPVAEAIRRLKGAGVVIRAAGPIVRGINDTEDAWFDMWRECVGQGIVPYYMYVERGTATGSYFSVTVANATRIYRGAVSRMSGLAQTGRGPIMAAALGKVVIDGIGRAGNEEVFACRFLRARDPALVGIPFFAKYDEGACWFDQLRPAFGERRFFFEAE
jgi:KamA family protein